MIIQFVYGETDKPGPFKVEGGFKFKCAVIPNAFGVGVENQAAVIQASAPKLDSILPEFASYKAPNVGVFMSDAEFAALPKEYVFTANGRGTYAFGRLFTCGVNHGRPNTPFHQGFILDDADRGKLLAELKRTNAGVALRPIDFAFANVWVNPRGEDEVNAVEIDGSSFPYPNLREADLSHIHHQAFDSSSEPISVVEAFGQAIFDNKTFKFPQSLAAHFPNWVSLLTHSIPNPLAWRTLFSSIAEIPSQLPGSNALFTIVTGAGSTSATKSSVKTWAEVVRHAFDGGLDTELFAGVDAMSKLFYGAHQNDSPEQVLRSGLSPLLLAYLFMEQALFDEGEQEQLADNIVDALFEIGLPVAFKSESSREQIGEWMDQGDRLVNSATRGDLFLGKLLDLQVHSGTKEGE